MPVLTANRVKFRQSDFSGGQNSSDEPASIGKNQAVLLQNSIITKSGKCTQRNGITKLGDGPFLSDSYDKLLLHMDGDDDGTTFTDSSATGRTITRVNAVTKTGVKKFGTASGYFDGTGDYLTAPDHDDWTFETGDFSVEAWVYFTDITTNSTRIIIAQGATSESNASFIFSWVQSVTSLNFYISQNGSDIPAATAVTFSWTPTINTWYHLAVSRNGVSLRLFIDGDLKATTTMASGVDAFASDQDLSIGANKVGTTPGNFFIGYIDEVRISKGIARWTADFNVPTEAYSTAGKILGITNFHAGTSLDAVLRARLTQVEYLNDDQDGWEYIDGITLTTGLETNFVQALDKCFVLNGTDNVFSIDSSLAVTDEGDTNTDFPKTTVAEWTPNNRMFASGSLTSTERDYVWFSNAIAPQTWDRATNVFKVRSGDNGKVTWLKAFKEFELIVYKNDSIFVLNMEGATPLTDWNLKPLSVAVGCPAGRTVCDIGNDHIFLANDGVRLLSRTTFDKLRVGVISDPIRDIIEDINQGAISSSNAWFENGLYILNIPVGTSTTPNRTVIWDSIAAQRNGDPNSAWTVVPTDTWNLSCMSSFSFGDNVKTFIGGSSKADSLVYKVLSGTTDNGTAIVQKIITKQIDFDEAFSQKIFDPSQFIADGGSDGIYLIEMQVDEGGWVTVGQIALTGNLTTPFTTPETTVAFANATGNFRTKFAGRGHYVQYRITNSVSGKIPTFIEYTTYARPYIGRI